MRLNPALCLRYALQVISLVFFIFLIAALYYPLGPQAALLEWFTRLDPWTLFSHLRWQHSIPSWWWLPLLTLVITLLLGRVFCGWLCPFGALLMLVDKAGRAVFRGRPSALLRANILRRVQPARYYWLLFLAVIFILGSNWTLFLTPFALFSHEVVRILHLEAPWVLIGIIAGTLFFSRLWCSVLCPTGMLLSLTARPRLFRYQTAGGCVQCGKCAGNCSVGAALAGTGARQEGCLACGDCQRACPAKAVNWRRVPGASRENEAAPGPGITGTSNNHSRRQFLKMAFAAAVAAAAVFWAKTAGAAEKVLRPPGALPEADFTSVCNRCGRCYKACPNDALRPMPVTYGFERYETPYIIPRETSCILCFTCQEVCPTGAIARVPLEQVRMGRAELDQRRCIAWSENKLCLICAEQCPVLAVESDSLYRPAVLPDKCVGCGTCEKACPVDGEAAIRVIPS